MGKLVKDPAGDGTGLLNGSSEETNEKLKKNTHMHYSVNRSCWSILEYFLLIRI